MRKFQKVYRLITPVPSPPPREGSDRKTVKQKIMYTLPWLCVPIRSPSPHQGGYYAALPSPALKWGMVSATGFIIIPEFLSKALEAHCG
jgi:hypothetical protein